MKTFVRSALNLCAIALLTFIVYPFVTAQSANLHSPAAPAPLITQTIDETQLTVLKGNTHPLAHPEFDLGTAPATLPMNRMLLVMKRSDAQESSLRQLLDDQQDKSSASYHKWLTPEDYGKQFGPTDTDLQTITAWLQSHGFQVGSTKGRTVLEFSGSASQVQEAFHTTIHKYNVNAQQYWANSSDPQIPTALSASVAGIASLNNFPRHPMLAKAGNFKRDKSTGKITATNPQFTFPNPCAENNSSNDPCFYGIGPYDFGTIYNVQPLWTAGINGTNETIAIVGETNINIQDVRDFRTLFGLPANDPQIILNGPDPGIQGDETEADLDVQWSGAVAPNATIDLVVSQSTETSAGTDLSAVYIIENNLAGIMSESYGECELGLGTAGNQFYNAIWQQASAQGITVFISAGDNGAAGCDNFDAGSPSPAQYGLQVSGYASTPYNVAVGGTDFNDFSNPATYWNLTNNSTTQASAKSYIPETTWNSSCTNAIFGTLGFSSSPETNCNDYRITPYFDVPLGGSGGVSACTTPTGSTTNSCAGGYAKPSWQTGTGVPNDQKRDLPDVSLFASNGFLGNFYIICQSDLVGSCSLNYPYQNFIGVGGTSASSPAFAGIMALVNQKTQSRQGNANYIFYKLATKQAATSCNSSNGSGSTCVFNDITSGTIAMPCNTNSPNCTTSIAGDTIGILTGYNAGTGYDLATGLGSVNANNLVNQWSSVSTLPSTTTLSSVTPTTVTHGQPVSFSVTVAPQSGSGTPSGQISLVGGPNNQSFAGFNLTSGSINGSSDLLPGGSYSLTAHYDGDGTYAPSDSSPISVTVNKENSQPQVFLVTFDTNGNIINSNTNTAPYGSPYLLRASVANAAGGTCAPANSTTPTACPTGDVTLTDNGTALGAGTYLLNSFGYFEYQTVQLPGGINSVKAAYAGDNSFNTSTTTTSLTITPAFTSIYSVTGPSGSLGTGADYYFSVFLQTNSSGVAPTGTVTFYSNGVKLPGTPQYSFSAGSGNQPAFLNATLDVNFSTAGSKSITAAYSGDANYAASSTPSGYNVNVFYPIGVTLSASSTNVSSGATVLLTAQADAGLKSPTPTGTFTFTDQNGVIGGAQTITTTKDSSGNAVLQATINATVTSAELIYVQYSGDNNFFGSNSQVFITVPDFGLSSSSLYPTVVAGQPLTLTININDEYGFTGTVNNFTCAGLPAETSCTFSPSSITGSGSVTLNIQTQAVGNARKKVVAADHQAPRWPAQGLAILLAAVIVGVSVRHRQSTFLALLLCALLIGLPSCGGGSGGNSTTTTVNNPAPSISSLAPAALAAGSTSSTLTINGSGFISSSEVIFGGVGRQTTYISSSQLSIQLNPSDLMSMGTFPVNISNPTPGGGQSPAVNFNVVSGTPTGSFPVTITATGAGFTHSANFALQVQ
jgi:hypothetical protein